MYTVSTPLASSQMRTKRKKQNASAFLPENALRVIDRIEQETGNASLRNSLFFSTGVVDRIERELSLGGQIIADSNLVSSGIDRDLAAALAVQVNCFIDDPSVVRFAMQKHITRAEIAVDHAVSLRGSKLIVVGSAPMALNRLLQLHQNAALRETVIIAAVSGFAGAIDLKERLRESGLPCIVARGRKGGAGVAIAIANALLSDTIQQRT